MELMKWWTWTHLVVKLWTIVSNVIVVELESEFLFHVRGHHTLDLLKHNVVNNKEKAEELLQRYGYLRCNHGKKHRSRVKKKGGRFCSKLEVREAIKRYQRLFNMPQTGKLDKATLKMMSASRCGNRDDEIGPQSLETFTYRKDRKRLQGITRQKRHLDSETLKPDFVIIENIKMDSIKRRKNWFKNRMKASDDNEQVRPTLKTLIRKKRAIASSRDTFINDIITWRLIEDNYSDRMTIKAQKLALALAFRMWNEVIPRIFFEDNISPVHEVDILIGFGRGEHLNCLNKFDGLGGQLSHAIKRLTKAEIHVDDDEYFTLGAEKGTNFLKVAVHEVGHVLGLIHSRKNYSIMYAIYSEMISNRHFELGQEDRQLVQSIYGMCEGKFSTVFDWVRKRHDGQLIYNTYFFRDDHYWMYENQFNRTRYGDPLYINTEWKGLQGPLDGFAHIWTSKLDVQLFFKGNIYWKYNKGANQISEGYPKLISEGFRGMWGTNNSAIPNDIDSVYFDKRDDVLLFFKKNLVYGYDVSKGNHGCCLPGYPKNINMVYKSLNSKSQLPSHLDAVYYSYTDKTLYFLKDNEYWIVVTNRHYRSSEYVQGPYLINQKWRDICDVQV